MVPESVIKKMTEDEKSAYIEALEANVNVLKEKNDIIENLYNENQRLQEELEELKSTHPVYQIKEMNEMADYVISHKEEFLNNPDKDDIIANILRIAEDDNLYDEQIKDLIINAMSMANKFRLKNKLEGTDSEGNIIIP